MKALSEMGDVAKREALREKAREMLKAKTPEEKDKVERIVDTLMEF